MSSSEYDMMEFSYIKRTHSIYVYNIARHKHAR